ncbi:Lrp/AsnC family transcriptional regulator [Aliikangiella sp. G2MR2-5]|uniref:Lrp/AsnC family transcriptional regulator n=1 Tax=Aliikangiella sp. G2MR2-5 TaxID=2788943 RepID=UPI0018A8F5B8|nr:Lrp/AsnC family transcriptional regulator [Aliikangiella sp. G2MR2-5]
MHPDSVEKKISKQKSRSHLLQEPVNLNELEKQLINRLQGDLPLTERPFLQIADELGTTESEVILVLNRLLEEGVITRFGPLFDISKGSGCFSLCALKVPQTDIDRIASIVNEFPQVAHNYLRDNEWNMWFVLAAKCQDELTAIFEQIVELTGCPGINCPKEKEFFVGLNLPV